MFADLRNIIFLPSWTPMPRIPRFGNTVSFKHGKSSFLVLKVFDDTMSYRTSLYCRLLPFVPLDFVYCSAAQLPRVESRESAAAQGRSRAERSILWEQHSPVVSQ